MKQVHKIKFSEDLAALTLRNITDFAHIQDILDEQIKVVGTDVHNIRQLVVCGCEIDDFTFLKGMSGLTRLAFFGCQSDRWDDINGMERITSLRLHNLKQGKRYLGSIDFLHAFPNLEYLYINMLGVSKLPDISDLTQLHTVMGTFRNENAVHELYDYSAFELLPSLKMFCSTMAVDRHRIPADTLVPVLKNSSVESVIVNQMYSTEDKKLCHLMEKWNPKLVKEFMSKDELSSTAKFRFAVGKYFAW